MRPDNGFVFLRYLCVFHGACKMIWTMIIFNAIAIYFLVVSMRKELALIKESEQIADDFERFLATGDDTWRGEK